LQLTTHSSFDEASVGAGDVFVAPSWGSCCLDIAIDLDAFAFSDAPVYEALGLYRGEPAGG
jgi:gentisate 1,2-dioxygenase